MGRIFLAPHLLWPARSVCVRASAFFITGEMQIAKCDMISAVGASLVFHLIVTDCMNSSFRAVTLLVGDVWPIEDVCSQTMQ